MSIEVVNDKVVTFGSETKTSKAGKAYTIHTVVLEKFGPISLGFTKPETLSAAAGDQLAMEVEKKFGQWQMVRELDKDAEATMTVPPATAPKGGGFRKAEPKVFPVPADHGDMAIIHQNALTNAIRYYSEVSGKTGDIWDVDDVISLAYVFADFSSGAHLKRMADKEK